MLIATINVILALINQQIVQVATQLILGFKNFSLALAWINTLIILSLFVLAVIILALLA